MKEGFRQSMAWLHTWAGLLVGWILYFVFLTGTAGYFDAEIDRWMRPELPMQSAPVGQAEAVRLGLARLQERAPGAERWTIHLPNRNADNGFRVSWRMPSAADGTFGQTGGELLDNPPDGAAVTPRQTGGGQLLYQMHYRLHYLDAQKAYWIVGFCTIFMLVAIITGVIVHKKIFKDFFTFRPGKGQRSWLDAHNVLSVVALPFQIMITYSGLVFFMFTYMPLVLTEVYGDESRQAAFFDAAYPDPEEVPSAGVPAPLTDMGPLLATVGADRTWYSVSVRNPGDANARIIFVLQRSNPQSGAQQLVFDGVSGNLITDEGIERFGPRKANDALIGLHEGLFAGPLLRWVYFLSGLLGTAMIATGLILWTVKRRAQQAKKGTSFGLHVVERLNAGTILGLPLGIAAYFWANRLLPAGFDGRGQWEAHALFIVWALALIYPVLRPVMRAWFELAAGAAVLYALIPVINALTTDRHLGVTLPHEHWHGDWVLAGFDLTMIAVAAAFAACGFRIWKKLERPATVQPDRLPSSSSLSLPAEALK